jgi:hypothetical protein
VTGVYSISAGASCTSPSVRNVYTRLDSFGPLVDRAFEYAGATKVIEPDPGAAGSGSGGSAGDAGLGGGPGDGGKLGFGGNTSGGSEALGGSESGGTSSGGRVVTGGNTSESGGSEIGEGSGSRKDSSCACRVAGSRQGGFFGAVAALGLALAMSARRHWRSRTLPLP